MQAWDSVQVRADIELGGTEQLYSFMMARYLQRDQQMPGQIGIMSPILVGLDGKKRMGKSLGNYIGISEPPYEMMKKFMQLPDDCMWMYFELLTDFPLDEIGSLLAGHPKQAKLVLAKTIIAEYHDPSAAEDVARQWHQEVARKEIPADIPEQVIRISEEPIHPGGDPAPAGIATFTKRDSQGNPLIRACDLYFFAKLCKSKSEARRLVKQGGAYLGEDKLRIEDPEAKIVVEPGLLLWCGNKKVVRLFPQG